FPAPRGRRPSFLASVSSEEVAHGKPAPDVYVEAARRLDVVPAECVAVEDSSNGIRAGAAAGVTGIARPNAHVPPDGDALALAAVVVPTVQEVTVGLVAAATRRRR